MVPSLTDRPGRDRRRGFCKSLLAIVLALPMLAVSGAGAPVRAEETVLLLGNSFLAGIRPRLRNVARSAGHDLDVRAYAGQGWSLANHASSLKSLRRIQAGGWDHVVLQEQSDGFPEWRYPDARLLDSEASVVGANTVLMMTWRDRGDELASWDDLHGEPGGDCGYIPIALELGASVAPAGWAFREVVLREDNPELWRRDGHHADERGRYLAALVLFTTIYKESPLGLWGPKSMSPGQILHDQILVEELVLGDPARWNIESPIEP